MALPLHILVFVCVSNFCVLYVIIYNLHAHVDIGVRGRDQILSKDQLPAELKSNVCKRKHDGETDRASEDESVGITCETYTYIYLYIYIYIYFYIFYIFIIYSKLLL